MLHPAHLLLDEAHKILQDSLTLSFKGAEHEAALQERLKAIETEIAQQSTLEIARTLLRYNRAIAPTKQRYYSAHCRKN